MCTKLLLKKKKKKKKKNNFTFEGNTLYMSILTKRIRAIHAEPPVPVGQI